MTLQSKEFYGYSRIFIITILLISILFTPYQSVQASQNKNIIIRSSHPAETDGSTQVFIPFIQKPPTNLPTVNIPFFEGTEINYHQAAISWFGQVRGNENYADIRVGYNTDEVYVRVSIFDRFLWYDQNPDIYNLTDWDAVTIYLDIDGNSGNSIDSRMYRFTRQLQWWDDQLSRQIAYQGNGIDWAPTSIPFTSSYSWRGNAPNDTVEDRGYVITFHIPFDSLGYTTIPAVGTKWGAAITLHDRDDANGYTYSEKQWPQNFNSAHSSTWSQFSFGLPNYTPPPASNPQLFTIRNGLNNAFVEDEVVGGNTQCGQGLDFWWQWGDYTYPSTSSMNVQNQSDIADWPCFSKFYLTFSLDSLPSGQSVISATLTLHQSGQATGFPDEPPEALNSLVQVFTIGQNWDDSSISWNNSPAPLENISETWIGAITSAEVGKARKWDISRAFTDAYTTGNPLRLVVYSADSYGPHGKYFFTSNQESEIMRPSLTVQLDTP